MGHSLKYSETNSNVCIFSHLMIGQFVAGQVESIFKVSLVDTRLAVGSNLLKTFYVIKFIKVAQCRK